MVSFAHQGIRTNCHRPLAGMLRIFKNYVDPLEVSKKLCYNGRKYTKMENYAYD